MGLTAEIAVRISLGFDRSAESLMTESDSSNREAVCVS
jgi:hypothetical protein